MTHILTLRTYPDMAAAIAAIDQLYSAFLKAHKRKTSVELMVSSTSGSYDKARKKFVGQEIIEVRAHHAPEHLVEAQWLMEEANRT